MAEDFSQFRPPPGLRSGHFQSLLASSAVRRHVVLRRSAAAKKEKPLSFGGLHLDPVTRITRRGDRAFDLTPTEFDLLHYLMLHPRHVLSRNRILERVWGYRFSTSSRTIDNFIVRLRRYFESDPKDPQYIHSVRGVGYRFTSPD